MVDELETGDSIIYPHYGAGRIVDERTIRRNGEEKDYYVINILMEQQTVMLPKNEEEEVGVREPTEQSEFLKRLDEVSEQILDLYDETEEEHPDKIHRKTLQSMLDDVRQGDLDTIMEGLTKLHSRFLDQELNVTEKRFYDTARQFIVGELMVIEDLNKEEANKRLEEFLPTELPEGDYEESKDNH